MLTVSEADALADRTLLAIDGITMQVGALTGRAEDDRERVLSDLAGVHSHYDSGGWCTCDSHRAGQCEDAGRYAEGLRRTARLYGVA